MASPPSSTTKLILHIDINKTVVLTDVASGSSLSDVINSCLALSSWGTVTQVGDDAFQWTAADHGTLPISFLAPIGIRKDKSTPGKVILFESSSSSSSSSSQCSYEFFVKEIRYPYVNTRINVVTGEELTPEESSAAINQNLSLRQLRKIVVDKFVSPGEPGNVYKRHHDYLLQKLTVPEEARAACAAVGLRNLARGTRLLLPSYFRLLEHLVCGRSVSETTTTTSSSTSTSSGAGSCASSTAATFENTTTTPSTTPLISDTTSSHGRQFFLAFRTFGHDLMDVVVEHNVFCRGQHPLHPRPGGDTYREAFEQLCIKLPDSTGVFTRDTSSSSSSAVATSKPSTTSTSSNQNEGASTSNANGRKSKRKAGVGGRSKLACILRHKPRHHPHLSIEKSETLAGKNNSDKTITTTTITITTASASIPQQHMNNNNDDEIDLGLPHVGALTGYREIYDHWLSYFDSTTTTNALDSTSSGGRGNAAAYRDDYVAWFASGEKGFAGKLMCFDPNDPHVHSIFWDDNCGNYEDKQRFMPAGYDDDNNNNNKGVLVEKEKQEMHSQEQQANRALNEVDDNNDDDDDDCGIVDARCVTTGESLGWSDVKNKYCAAVDPLTIALNDDYFVELLHLCESNRKGKEKR